MTERDKALKAAKTNRSDDLWVTYKHLKNKVNHLMRKNKREYSANQISQNQNNSKKMWRCLRDLVPKSLPISPNSINVDGANVSENVNIAEAFNDFFISNASKITKDLLRNPSQPGMDEGKNAGLFHSQFDLTLITRDFVLKQIDNLSIDKAIGEDHISCKLLKMTKNIIAESLCDIINKSLSTGVVPRKWKKARVVPIFKSGDISSMNNYRPISILPIVSKIIERAVHQQLSEFLDANDLLHPNQSGFRPKHSTATALAKLVNQWSLNIDNNKISGVAFIDLRKAFDTVDHELLLHKLACIGCSKKTITWFKSYLGDRQQVTQFKGAKSHPSTIKLGVPQGSILGPLLFSIYVNSLPECVPEGIIDMYADDTTLTVSANDATVLEEKLTVALKRVMAWIRDNRLVLNAEKTCVMIIGSHANLRKIESFTISLNGNLIKRVQFTKCLGVMIDEELKWFKQVDNVCKLTQKSIGMLKRAKCFLPVQSLRLLYNSLVLPRFDYCSIIWSNRFHAHTNKLRKIQKRAARIILNKTYDTPSADLFTSLKWMTLDKRFELSRVMMIYKCVHNLAPSYLQVDLINPNEVHEHDTRQSASGCLRVPRFHTECYKCSPVVSSIFEWNKLDNAMKTASSVNSFKRMFKQSCNL